MSTEETQDSGTPRDELDALDAETVEDLEVDEDAEEVEGGEAYSHGCVGN